MLTRLRIKDVQSKARQTRQTASQAVLGRNRAAARTISSRSPTGVLRPKAIGK